jgi:hypothetical protein
LSDLSLEHERAGLGFWIGSGCTGRGSPRTRRE